MSKQIQYEDGEWSREIDTREEPPMTTSDPTPGNHDELLDDIESRIDFYYLNNEPQFEAGSEVDLMFQSAKALRTEQTARQAAEQRERTLIVGVKEALTEIDSWLDNDDFRQDMEQVKEVRDSAIQIVADEIRKPLSRLLPSTPTEEGQKTV